MPTWGIDLQMGVDEPNPASEARVRRRISDMVHYLETLQENDHRFRESNALLLVINSAPLQDGRGRHSHSAMRLKSRTLRLDSPTHAIPPVSALVLP